MNMEAKKKPCCSQCGASRKPSELNGSFLNNGSWDYSKAYCSRIAQCDSKEANSQIDVLVQDLHSEAIDSLYSKDELVNIFTEQLKIIDKQTQDENIRVKLHFGLVCKSSCFIELFQCLYPLVPVPGSLIQLSNSISDSYFN